MTKDMLELAERCKNATEPSVSLDRAICKAVLDDEPILATPFTASLDAAMTLVPEGACWRVIAWPKNTSGPKAGALIEGSPDATGATPALALCAAALRARANNQGG